MRRWELSIEGSCFLWSYSFVSSFEQVNEEQFDFNHGSLVQQHSELCRSAFLHRLGLKEGTYQERVRQSRLPFCTIIASLLYVSCSLGTPLVLLRHYVPCLCPSVFLSWKRTPPLTVTFSLPVWQLKESDKVRNLLHQRRHSSSLSLSITFIWLAEELDKKVLHVNHNRLLLAC